MEEVHSVMFSNNRVHAEYIVFLLLKLKLIRSDMLQIINQKRSTTTQLATFEVC
jgi:hypothetical protein